jgi:hypothetical protein
MSQGPGVDLKSGDVSQAFASRSLHQMSIFCTWTTFTQECLGTGSCKKKR